jgi:hypothetical protein
VVLELGHISIIYAETHLADNGAVGVGAGRIIELEELVKASSRYEPLLSIFRVQLLSSITSGAKYWAGEGCSSKNVWA